MLVLAREIGEGFKIGDEITVTVLAVRGGYVRLGISAPREVLVLRGELQERGMPAQAAEPADDDHA